MTWRTEIGERVIEGHEAVLIREAIAAMKDMFEEELDDDIDPWKFGVPVFDRLETLVKLALLAEVGWALLRSTERCPPLTAVNESAVGAIFGHIEQSVQYEIDCHDSMTEESFSWRRLILNVFHQIEDTDELPDALCLDPSEWDILQQVLADRILWDDDFNDEALYVDQPADHGKFLKDFMTIDDDYFTAPPPNPRESDLPRILKILNELTQESTP